MGNVLKSVLKGFVLPAIAFNSTFWAGFEIYLREKHMRDAELENNNLIPMEETLKRERIEEYKKLFLEDKNLKLVFNEEELDRSLKENLERIGVKADLEDGVLGTYNSFTKNMLITKSHYYNELEHIMFHELVHVVFTRSEGNTGLHTGPKHSLVLRGFFSKGVALNEGGTEYITKKLINKKSYDSWTAYGDYVSIFQTLCMTYGEDFMFRALKNGEEELAEQLEKDDVSYNELVELLDESLVQRENGKEDELIKRAKEITRQLFVKKYLAASPEEKFEIAKRVRNIIASQTLMDNINLYDSNIRIILKPLEEVNYMDIGEWINVDLYKMYTANHEIIGGLDKKLELAIQSAINTAILGTKHIPIEDMKEILLEEVKDKNNFIIGYILKFKGKMLSIMYSQGEKNMSAHTYNNVCNMNPSLIRHFMDLEGNYKLLEPIQLIELDNVTSFVLNTEEGTKFFSYENSTNELIEYSVEDKFSLRDVIVEKIKAPKHSIFNRTTAKLLEILNINQKDIELLSKWNTAFPNNVIIDSKYFDDNKREEVFIKFSDNINENNFREKYKVETTEFQFSKYGEQERKNNLEEKER